jgi:hypothetical protein
MKNRRIITGVLLMLLIGGAWAVVARNDGKGRVTASAIWELWTDVLRDTDNFGLRLTRVSEAEEMAFGDRIASGFELQLSNDAKQQKYLDDVGAALTPNVRRKGVSYKFHLIDAPFMNAFAIPGGHIYVTKSLMDFVETEAELAAVLGHEISHVDLGHCIERFQYQLQLEKVTPSLISELTAVAYRTLTVGYSKQQEHEADIRAVTLAAQANYHPKYALSTDDRMADIEEAFAGRREPKRFMIEELTSAVLAGATDYLKSHPDWRDRIDLQAKTLAKNEPDWRGRVFYVGRSNHADRISRAEDDRRVEHSLYEESPGLRPYVTAVGIGPFKALAVNVPSGLSASAGDEPSPELAINAAMRECETKMAPCVLYALGDRLTFRNSAQEIDAVKAGYLKAVCADNPPKRAADICAGAGAQSEAPRPAGAPQPADGERP